MNILLKDLIEGYYDTSVEPRRTPVLYNDDLKKRMEIECSTSIGKYREGIRMFRGLKSANKDIYFISPSKHMRSSRNTSNFFTSLIDSSNRWKNYPKRSRSIICTTDYFAAKAYGSVYNIFPKNGAKIGICSEDDIWSSVDNILAELGLYVNDFNNLFYELYDEIGESQNEMERLNYENIDNILNKFDEFIQKNGIERFIELPSIHYSKIATHLKNNYRGNIRNYFDDLLDPVKNNFKLVSIEEFNITSRFIHEIWTDGDSYMVDEDFWKTIN